MSKSKKKFVFAKNNIVAPEEIMVEKGDVGVVKSENQNAKNNRSVRRPSCKDCRVKMEGIGVSRINRVKWLKKKPHNNPFECPICKKRTIAGVTSKVVLEHDHRTGKPGGWICDSCNTGLGRFKDYVELLKSAIEFLKKNY